MIEEPANVLDAVFDTEDRVWTRFAISPEYPHLHWWNFSCGWSAWGEKFTPAGLCSSDQERA